MNRGTPTTASKTQKKPRSRFAALELEYMCVCLLLQITKIKSKFTSKQLCRCVEIQYTLQTSPTLIRLNFFFNYMFMKSLKYTVQQ